MRSCPDTDIDPKKLRRKRGNKIVTENHVFCFCVKTSLGAHESLNDLIPPSGSFSPVNQSHFHMKGLPRKIRQFETEATDSAGNVKIR